jgi:hypothetical protein
MSPDHLSRKVWLVGSSEFLSVRRAQYGVESFAEFFFLLHMEERSESQN